MFGLLTAAKQTAGLPICLWIRNVKSAHVVSAAPQAVCAPPVYDKWTWRLQRNGAISIADVSKISEGSIIRWDPPPKKNMHIVLKCCVDRVCFHGVEGGANYGGGEWN